MSRCCKLRRSAIAEKRAIMGKEGRWPRRFVQAATTAHRGKLGKKTWDTTVRSTYPGISVPLPWQGRVMMTWSNVGEAPKGAHLKSRRHAPSQGAAEGSLVYRVAGLGLLMRVRVLCLPGSE